MAAPSQRLHSLDSLRGSMMLLGLLLHSAILYMEAPLDPRVFPLQDERRHAFFDLLVFFIHNFRMPLFFILAGFFGRMVLEKYDWQVFLKHRLLRLGLPLALFLPPLYLLSRYYSIAYGARQEDIPFGFGVLWFLYHLIVFTLVVSVLRASRLPLASADGFFARLWFGPLRWPLLVLVTAGLLWTQYGATLHPDVALFPYWAVPTFYALFYLTGWMIFGQRDAFPVWTQRPWRLTLLAVVLLVPYLASILPLIESFKREPTPLIRESWNIPEPMHTIGAFLGAIVLWLFVFGLTGLFQRYMAKPSALSSYLARSAYWVYLTHFFAILFLGNSMHDLSWPIFEILIVLLGTTAFSFATFELLVNRRPWAYIFGAAPTYSVNTVDLKQAPVGQSAFQ